MTTILLGDLTQANIDGSGIFDVLMRANKVHLEAEFAKGRIKGTEYATVYLGSLEAVMRTSLEFLVQREQIKMIGQQTTNLELQALNIPKEGLVLDGQYCKLKAEWDLLKSEILKSSAETALLSQKGSTERAQTMALGVDADSVIGKQKSLYEAQTNGFARDAEQKAASILVGTWNARRMTNDTTVHDTVNKLDDANIGAFISKLKAGVNA